MDREAWRATVNGLAKSQTQLNDLTHTCARYLTCFLHVLVNLNIMTNLWD